MKRYKILSLILALVLLPTMALSEDGADKPLDIPLIDLDATKQAANGVSVGLASKLDISVDVTATTAYFFRGINLEDKGFILQPSVNVAMPLDDEWRVYGTWWNSFHDQDTGAAGNDIEEWFETRFTVGADVILGQRFGGEWTAGVFYNAYTSPNNAFSTVHELGVKLEFDDSGLWKGKSPFGLEGWSGLQPYALVAFEIDGARDGMSEGSYLELGLYPHFSVGDFNGQAVMLGLPVRVGFGMDEYYESAPGEDHSEFGFASIGAELTVPLRGNLNLTLGVDWLFLGNQARDFNSGESDEIIGKLGIGYSF